MLRDVSPNIKPNPNRVKVWRASLRVSAGRIWGSWPYSQPRAGVVNRLSGIISDRAPLAHVRFVHIGKVMPFRNTIQNAVCVFVCDDYVVDGVDGAVGLRNQRGRFSGEATLFTASKSRVAIGTVACNRS